MIILNSGKSPPLNRNIIDEKALDRLKKLLQFKVDNQSISKPDYCTANPDFAKALELVKNAPNKEKNKLTGMVKISELENLDSYNSSTREKERKGRLRKVCLLKI